MAAGTASSAKKPKTGKVSTENMFFLKGKWYMRQRVNGREVRRCLQKDDVTQARRLVDAHLAQQHEEQEAVRKLESGVMPWPMACGRFLMEARGGLSKATPS